MVDVRIDRVTKCWGDQRAVDDVSIAVPSGSFVALLGPSGCGKSTTLRLIAGLDTPTSGRIAIGGCDVTHLPPSRRGIAMVFQSYALFPHLTVRENILFGLRIRKVARGERDRQLSRVAEMLALGALLERKPGQLSGGQQQRVALARAIVAEAPVCLMDEPLSNLDAQLRGDMRREIRRIQRSLGMTLIYVTHDQVEAMSMADHVVLMNGGRVEQSGAPETIYEEPASTFAARFIGVPPMNILPLRLAPRIAAARAPGVALIDGLALGLRPEVIRLDPAGLPATIANIEYLGADMLLELTCGGAGLTARVSARSGMRAGDKVHISWPREAERWFDAASGRRWTAEADGPRAASASAAVVA